MKLLTLHNIYYKRFDPPHTPGGSNMSIPNETLCAPAARGAARRALGGRLHLFAAAMQDRGAVPGVPIVPIGLASARAIQAAEHFGRTKPFGKISAITIISIQSVHTLPARARSKIVRAPCRSKGTGLPPAVGSCGAISMTRSM